MANPRPPGKSAKSAKSAQSAPSAPETLLRMLALERRGGYQNTAVVGGGLDQFLNRQRRHGDHPQLFTDLVAPLPREGYASLDPDARQQWATWVEQRLRPGAPPPRRAARINPSAEITDDDPPKQPRRPRSIAARARRDALADGKGGDDPLSRPVTALGRGISPPARKGFAQLGIDTVFDLLWHLPVRHQDWRDVRRIADVEIGETVTVVGEIRSIELRRLRGGREATEANVADGSGSINVWWWRQPWLHKTLQPGMRVGLSGVVDRRGRRLQLQSPEWERLDDPNDDTAHVGRLSPIYPLTKGLPNRTVRRLAFAAVRDYLPLLAESLPWRILAETGYPGEADALKSLHFPDNPEEMELARERLAFQELLSIQLAVLGRKREARRRSDAPVIQMEGKFLDRFLAALPFQLTAAQGRALTDIRRDLARSEPMARLLQGDVGSGKTIVAAAAMLAAVKAGYQTVLMAPTEVLAQQHYDTFQRIFADEGESVFHNYAVTQALGRPVRIELLTGSTRKRRKDAVREGMASGDVDLVIGTHALIQERTALKQLGLAVVDEQHRFGVLQRDALRGKGGSPHLLVMTATPIPRTLALTIYGELDVSVINELPPGRQRVATKVISLDERDEVYERILREAAQGRQSFVICPLVEESDHTETAAATAEFQRLRTGPLAPIADRMRLLHGRMKGDEKQRVMAELARGDADLLVATIVVEVGVDLPNATVMAVEGADRFGLAQLHQLRGRVGRSDLSSVCYLISESDGDEAQRRLGVMESSNDGFELAEVDLEMRGPGEYFGTRQTGLPDLRVAKLTDQRLIERARNWAERLLDDDPYLRAPEHRLLAARAARLDVSAADAVH